MAFDGDRVTVTYDAGIDRPLRLTHEEALALIVALRDARSGAGQRHLPGAAGDSREAVERALAKIESAAGGDGGRRVLPVAVRLPGVGGCGGGSPGCDGRSASGRCSCTTTSRLGTSGPSGWSTRCGCYWSMAMLSGGVVPPGRRGPHVPGRSRGRVVELEEPAGPPPQAHERNLDDGVYQPEPGRLPPSGCGSPGTPAGSPTTTRWTPWRRSTTPPGGLAVTVRTADLAWARGNSSWPPSAGRLWSTSRPAWRRRSPPMPGLALARDRGGARPRTGTGGVRVAPCC